MILRTMGTHYDNFLTRYNMRDKRANHRRANFDAWHNLIVFTDKDLLAIEAELNKSSQFYYRSYFSDALLLIIFKLLATNTTIKNIFVGSCAPTDKLKFFEYANTHLINNAHLSKIILTDTEISTDEINLFNNMLNSKNIVRLRLYNLVMTWENWSSLMQTINLVGDFTSLAISSNYAVTIDWLSGIVATSTRLKTLECVIRQNVCNSSVRNLCAAIQNNKMINSLTIRNESIIAGDMLASLLLEILPENKSIINLTYQQTNFIRNLTPFLEQLNNYSLINLTLTCEADEEQMKILSDKLSENTTLMSLDLQSDTRVNVNVEGLLRALTVNNTLKALTMRGSICKTIDSFDFLNGTRLEYFNLLNHMRGEQIFNMLQVLEQNSTLKFVLFRMFRVDAFLYRAAIDKLFDANATILKLSDDRNSGFTNGKIKIFTKRNKASLSNIRFASTKVATQKN